MAGKIEAAGMRDELPSFSIAICTADRPRSLMRAIESVAADGGGMEERREMIIVDDRRLPQETIAAATRCAGQGGFKLCYIRKRPDERGLMRSRVSAIAQCSADVIFFIDDDVELEAPYIARMLEHYRRDDVVGVGGIDILTPLPSRLMLFAGRLFLQRSANPGRLALSGYSGALATWSSQKAAFVAEFLSGANMSFRTRSLFGLRAPPWLQGYAVGEDLYISHFARRNGGQLIVDPALRVRHHTDHSAKASSRALSEAKIRNPYYLLKVYGGGRTRYAALVWASIGALMGATIRRRSEQRAGYAAGLGAVMRWIAGVAEPKVVESPTGVTGDRYASGDEGTSAKLARPRSPR
jgi:glycosyltransferase involved in cell wall biosynthesis